MDPEPNSGNTGPKAYFYIIYIYMELNLCQNETNKYKISQTQYKYNLLCKNSNVKLDSQTNRT